MNLNREQTHAANHPSSCLAISAGAGSGKTTTLLARAIWEAEQGHQVRLAAFTRAAAKEMANRLDEMELDDLRWKIKVSTLHGFANDIARRLNSFSIVDGVDEKAIEREAKTRKVDADTIRKQARLVRYSDLLHIATVALSAGRSPIDQGGTLLVDEAQDLTREEWRFIGALNPERITAVGDHAQAIYGWRGGLPNFARELNSGWAVKDCPEHATLPTNYRSLQGVLDLANRLNIPGRIDLQAARGNGGQVEILHAEHEDQLLQQIVDLFGDGLGPDLGEWAILSRTKGRLFRLAEMLDQAGITYHAPALSGARWDTPEARAFIDIMHVVANPHDTFHLIRCLQRLGFAARDIDRAEQGRAVEACSMWDWLCAHIEGQPTAIEWMNNVHKARTEQFAVLGCAYLFGPPGPMAELPNLQPAEFLAWVADPDAREASAGDAPEDAITLATIHGAKGREWRNVIVLGCEDGSLPMTRKDTEIAEERRLFYVAITRAADRLILAHSQKRPMTWGKGILECQPSRFLEEIGL